MSTRASRIVRKTRETAVQVELELDGKGVVRINTGIGFLDHLLTSLALHARLDLTMECEGDTHVDDHHTAEDCALALGEAVDKALGERRGIARFGTAYAPLDESLARAVVDLSGRPFARAKLRLKGDRLGGLVSENAGHFLSSFATAARVTLHVDVLRGRNDHHKAEAAFKAVALALRTAIRFEGSGEVPSTKGVL